MTDKIKVSVLITTYNTEKYIGDAIKSFVEQELPFAWELLIGDDGSSDGTVAIVNEWIAKYPNRIQLFVHERGTSRTKVGSRAAKNRAFLLEKAKGEYIHYLDGDDCFLGTDTIKKQVEILDNSKYVDCSCCAQNILEYNIPTGEKVMLIQEGIGDKVYDIKQYWSRYYFHTDTILFRRACVDLMLKPQYRDFLNDNFITYLILQYGKVYYMDCPGAKYNQTGDGLWTGHSLVYGAFRNLQLYDLEIDVRKDIESLNFNKHKGDIRRIWKLYNKSHIEEVRPLMEGLDPAVFKTTLLFFKLEALTITERFEKFSLFVRASFMHHMLLLRHRFRKYILRK